MKSLCGLCYQSRLMTLHNRPCLCGVRRILKLSASGFSDQPLNKIHLPNGDRKKINVELTLSRLRLLYHFQEYLKYITKNEQFSSKNWLQQLFRKWPQLFSDKRPLSAIPEVPRKQETDMITEETPAEDQQQVAKPAAEAAEQSELAEEQKVVAKESVYSNLIGGWKPKQRAVEQSAPKWRNDVSVTSSVSVLSRAKHLLVLIDNAESPQSLVKRLEDLISFLLKHPEAKLIAVKEGALRKLLHIRSRFKDYTVQKIIREVLALLGHVDPLPGKGIRILSVDGGGIRGIAVIEMLKKIEELTGKRIYELFDYICGVSTGSILVSCIGTPQAMKLEDALHMYTEFGTKLFTQSPFWGVGNLVWNRAYYDTTMFEQLLKRFIGETPLIKTNRDANCPKLASVSTIMNHTSIMPYVFRNYALPCNRQSQFLGSCQYTLYEAVRASGAAPTVFQEFCLDGVVHQDGGILVNNPCAVAIHEAKLLWPNSEIQCVVSCGTGRHAPISVSADSSDLDTTKPSAVSWKTLFRKILESATDTEAVHTMLNDLLPPNVYFRFNPYLTDLIPMHENRPVKISQLREETALYIRRNEEKFVDAANNLQIKRTPTQKIQDFIDLKCFEYGLRNTVCKL